MGWTISHSTPRIIRPYGAIDELAQHVAHVLPARDWKKLAPCLQASSGDPIHIRPRDAARMATALRTAAQHPLMPRQWVDLADRLATAAHTAATRGETWIWS
ncbi:MULTISPECIES: DUF7739 domain-containing protein [Streptomyces]|uniref:DUF7739 domain-containing protein n=1 Tax=Streptomyces fradiae ATCC 10745 = DSM 40063 TaxID=1319510 RepID=A0A1Y2NTR8_STRFR|nr:MULTISPECIES: hypothetical protein [Streptomyces]KAF0646722.1 hypothetical protein K701_27465 [Streptomyces fradiae ATCC 10745 = DSM 40063]OSY50611.1 hypothetical protein BG846_03779 [Streptomyces fradiae ATCC 10745 = DSM 40063]